MNNKRILITGTHGFVGARACLMYPDAITVPPALVREAGEPLADFVRQHAPDIIINAAAISDIGACAADPDGSFAANVTLPTVLAKVSREIGVKLLSFSSDQVYTGCTHDGPYTEDEYLPTPKNLYAKHKLMAEEQVLDICPSAVLLRATWMYDMPLYAHKNRTNFLVNTLSALMRRQPVTFSASNYRGITYVRQVVSLLDSMAELPGGVYNYGSENPQSMLDTALAFADSFGLGDVAQALIQAEPADAPPRHNLWMSTAKLRAFGIAFDTTVEGFARCAADYGFISK